MTNRTSLAAAVLGCAVLCCALATAAVATRDAETPASAAEAPDGAAANKPPTKKPFESIETKDLHNAYRVTEKVLSGAAPENEQAFKDLKALGVSTIVSVDGAKPDVETAKRYGLRYVHLPIGYDGVEEAEGRRIAKALHELPGPVYIHCHHGKHRSAAAVAVACVLNGSLKPEQAESVLETFGTGNNYLGLWSAARRAEPMDADALAKVEVDYVEQAEIPKLAARMVALDKTWEHLKAIRKNDWRAPADHPDLDPAHEALQLQEHLHESGRLEDLAARPKDYRRLLRDGESGARTLRDALAATPRDRPRAEAAFTAVSNSCIACHKSYRD